MLSSRYLPLEQQLYDRLHGDVAEAEIGYHKERRKSFTQGSKVGAGTYDFEATRNDLDEDFLQLYGEKHNRKLWQIDNLGTGLGNKLSSASVEFKLKPTDSSLFVPPTADTDTSSEDEGYIPAARNPLASSRKYISAFNSGGRLGLTNKGLRSSAYPKQVEASALLASHSTLAHSRLSWIHSDQVTRQHNASPSMRPVTTGAFSSGAIGASGVLEYPRYVSKRVGRPRTSH